MVDSYPLQKDWSRIQQEILRAAEKLDKFYEEEQFLEAKLQHVESAIDELRAGILARIYNEQNNPGGFLMQPLDEYVHCLDLNKEELCSKYAEDK